MIVLFMAQLISLDQLNYIYTRRSEMSSNSIKFTGRSPSTPGQANRTDVFFKKKLETITEYIDFLENDPASAKNAETDWEKNFYKNELKAALALNYSLIQIMGQNEYEIKQLLLEISQLKKSKNPIDGVENDPNYGNHKPSSLLENKTVITPQRRKVKALAAEKNILGAKQYQEKEEYKKIIEKKDELLSSSKEQNSFLREKLLLLGQKIGKLEVENKGLKKLNRELRKNGSKGAQVGSQPEQPCERVLQFSPIAKRDEQSQVIIEQISFNQFRTPQKDSQTAALQGQIEQLKKLLAKAEKNIGQEVESQCRECQSLTEANELLRQEIERIKEYLVEVKLREEKIVRIQEKFREDWDSVFGERRE